jgi:ATP/maltotriose-dependent transcriptional regulator MalT
MAAPTPGSLGNGGGSGHHAPERFPLWLARGAQELQAGKRLSRDMALDLALGKTGHVAVAAPDNASAGLLGKREADVARLVTDGLTNKQIGARLSYPSGPFTATSAES